MKGIDYIPKCPICGGIPSIYSYSQDDKWPMRITGLLCGGCRQGPDTKPGEDPILSWIHYAKLPGEISKSYKQKSKSKV